MGELSGDSSSVLMGGVSSLMGGVPSLMGGVSSLMGGVSSLMGTKGEGDFFAGDKDGEREPLLLSGVPLPLLEDALWLEPDKTLSAAGDLSLAPAPVPAPAPPPLPAPARE